MKQNQQQTPLLPGRKAATDYELSQLEFYRGIQTNCSVSTMVSAQTPTLAKIKNEVSLADVRALLSIAICEVCDFFNVGKNMNDTQIAVTADLILNRFWYFHLEEVKYCFRRAMMYEKVFDRIDGNIILNWLAEYDAVRTEEAMRISEREESQDAPNPADSSQAISFEEYMASLRERAKTDKKALELLKSIENPKPQRLTFLTREERAEKEHNFKMWKMTNYLQQNPKR